MKRNDDGKNNSSELLAICIFMLIGAFGLPISIYQMISHSRSSWVCYSRHGHVLQSIAECKFLVYAGMLVSAVSIVIAVRAALTRYNT